MPYNDRELAICKFRNGGEMVGGEVSSIPPGYHNFKLENSDTVGTTVFWYIDFEVYSFRAT